MIDVLIAGGGPAGSAAAIRLAKLGHSVRLVERRTFPRPHVGESLSPGVRVHLANLGLEAPQSLVVDRAQFDSMLLDAARDAGVEVLFLDCGGRAAAFQSGGSAAAVHQFFIDATGRANLSRRPRRFTAPRLIAWHARFGVRQRQLPLFLRRGDDWFWGATLPDGTYTAVYTGALSQFTNSVPTSPPHAFDATPYVCDAPIDEHSASIGEAAFAIDPITSSGVQAAIGSAIAASTAVHTILRRPENTGAAIRFYTSHVQRVSAQHARWTNEVFEETPAAIADDLLISTNEHAQVIAPAIRGDFVELEPAIRTAAGDDVVYLGGTPLAPLVATIAARTPAHAILDRWSHAMPRPRAAAMLSWLVQQRAVIAERN
ncbi:MAG TPA: tryptophan 7-halogenase [Thermoanaerobaculia bacterium]|nr:tryptophan 7-halogenase [Thermoanaerobaculia bacterium]